MIPWGGVGGGSARWSRWRGGRVGSYASSYHLAEGGWVPASHQLGARGGAVALGCPVEAEVVQHSVATELGEMSTKTFADLQTKIEIAAVEDRAKTMRMLGENLIVLGEQTVAAQKQAENDYEDTPAPDTLRECLAPILYMLQL